MQEQDKVGLTRLENYYLMTNIKGVLTFILVCFHLISLRLNAGVFSAELLTTREALLGPIFMIGLGTVPLFVLITGYYSKDVDACRNTAFTTVLIPYIILQTVSMILFNLVFGKPITWDLFMPYFQLWYLLSLFIWNLTLKDVTRIKGSFVIMFIASLLVGVVLNYSVFTFDSSMDGYMSLFHTIAFYPYLLIGYYLKPEHINKIRNMSIVKSIGVVVAYLAISILFFVLVIKDVNLPNFSTLLLKGDSDYIDYLLQRNADGTYSGINSYSTIAIVGIVYRLVQYVTVILLGMIALRFFPKKKIPFLTRLGAASLTVYCLHTFIAIPLGTILPMGNLWIYILCVAVSAFATSWVLSLNAINKRYTKFILFVSDKLMKKPEKKKK